jgi:hypothetical protein
VITREQCFTLHGLKHRRITDTIGKGAEKNEASGHKTDAMLDYDHRRRGQARAGRGCRVPPPTRRKYGRVIGVTSAHWRWRE